MSSPAPIQAVLFDLDDTLYHREAAFQRWAHDFVHTQLHMDGEEARRLLGELAALDANGYGSKQAVFSYLHVRYPTLPGDSQSSADRFYDQFLTYVSLDEGAEQLVTALERAAVPFGVITNGGPRQWHKLQRLGLDRRTDCLFVSETFGAKKPDPAIFHAAAECLKTAPEEILFVGDHPTNDVAGARQAGMQTAWLHRDKPWPGHLAAVTPDHVIASLADLPRILWPA